MIAKSVENDEFKIAVADDPFFYLTREDLLILLQTNDIVLITHILHKGCNLKLEDNISYLLVSIKSAQVDHNQHTAVSLTDFLSVMVDNKRAVKYSIDRNIQFSHNRILKFLSDFKDFVKEDEVMKIFILGRRFRLTLQFMKMVKPKFEI
jgi:hypothetical protein